MSHLRILICICRVEDADDDQMTELACLDLPAERPTPLGWSPVCLDRIEATVARAGQHLLARLCELQWEEVEAQAVARYVAQAGPATVVAGWVRDAAGGQPLWYAGPAPAGLCTPRWAAARDAG